MKTIHDLFKEEISIQSIALPTVKDKIKSDPILPFRKAIDECTTGYSLWVQLLYLTAV